jgi:chemotaxis response regulator CheB
MGTSDGAVLGLTKILDNGPDDQRFNIVIVAEGYQGNTAADQTDFNDRCQQIVDEFRAEPWFGEGLLAAINIYRLNVRSTDSGADNPATCADMSTATAVTAATYFDATYCTAGVRRCLGCD